MIKTTKNIDEANAITHCGNFHLDDVMSAVICNKAFGDLVVYRTDKIPEKIPPNVIIFDIGGGIFDHHQKEGNGVRRNGVPYASCGLIWNAFGWKVLQNIKDVNTNILNSIIEKELIMGIDAVDNGALPKNEYPVHSINISGEIAMLNPTWDSNEDSDAAFLKAVSRAEEIFDTVLKNSISKMKAQLIVEEKISSVQNGILVLDKYMPWRETVIYSKNPKANSIKFVICPSDRNGYEWNAVVIGFGNNDYRKPVPKEWWGASAEELRKITGVKTATFCHYRGGFKGACETKEDAIKMAQIAINS